MNGRYLGNMENYSLAKMSFLPKHRSRLLFQKSPEAERPDSMMIKNIRYFCQSNTFPESESVLGFISTQPMILTEDSSVKMYRLESPGCVPLLQGVEHK